MSRSSLDGAGSSCTHLRFELINHKLDGLKTFTTVGARYGNLNARFCRWHHANSMSNGNVPEIPTRTCSGNDRVHLALSHRLICFILRSGQILYDGGSGLKERGRVHGRLEPLRTHLEAKHPLALKVVACRANEGSDRTRRRTDHLCRKGAERKAVGSYEDYIAVGRSTI